MDKFRFKLNTVGKTSRPFSCDLNRIPSDHAMEVTNGFKGLDPIYRMPDRGSRYCTGGSDQPTPRKGNAKGKNTCLRRHYK